MSYEVAVNLRSPLPLEHFDVAAQYCGFDKNGARGAYAYDQFEDAGIFIALEADIDWRGRTKRVALELCFGASILAASCLGRITAWLARGLDGEIEDARLARPVARYEAAGVIRDKWHVANLWALSTYESATCTIFSPANIVPGEEGRRVMLQAREASDAFLCIMTVLVCYARVERFDMAFRLAQKAMTLLPARRAQFRRNAAMSLWQLGRKVAARQTFDALIAESPGDASTREIVAALEAEEAERGVWDGATATGYGRLLETLEASVEDLAPIAEEFEGRRIIVDARPGLASCAASLRQYARGFDGTGRQRPAELEAAIARLSKVEEGFDALEDRNLEAVLKGIARG